MDQQSFVASPSMEVFNIRVYRDLSRIIKISSALLPWSKAKSITGQFLALSGIILKMSDQDTITRLAG